MKKNFLSRNESIYMENFVPAMSGRNEKRPGIINVTTFYKEITVVF